VRSSYVVLDQVGISFGDPRAVAHAGLPERLGSGGATDQLVDLGDRSGAARPGRKLPTLVHAMVAGGDRVGDVGAAAVGVDRQRARRSGGGGLHGGRWLRSFTFGQVRQLDKVTGELLTRAWAAGSLPRTNPVEVGE
jgi:hypothetical protein